MVVHGFCKKFSDINYNGICLRRGTLGFAVLALFWPPEHFPARITMSSHDSGSQKSYFEYVKVDSNLNVINVLNLSRTSER